MTLKFHSDYFGWGLYRLYDGPQARMHYEAHKGDRVLVAHNLSGIKDAVKNAEGKE